MNEVHQVILKIEELRKNLIDMAKDKELHSEGIVKLSEELDILINLYYTIIKSKL
jgi:hypothetical protein